ncbi:MAG: hypothetical protein V4506_17445 [Bacteroidota bacterium]
MKYNYLIVLLFTGLLAFPQGDLTKQIQTLMSQLRAQQPVTVDRGKIIASANYKETSEVLTKYASDTVLNVRYEALNMLSQSAIRSKDKTLIKKSIRNTIKNSVINNTINNQIVNLLKRNAKQDFENDELILMKATLESRENNIGNLAKIYAFAGGATVLMDLNALLVKPNLTKGDKKDLKLALTRCGDERYATKMNETLKQQVVNDELIYSALPDILYTKNKAMFSFLLDGILSDSKKCSSANNDDNTPMICAYRLIEQLAPEIVDFPATVNEKGEINSKDLPKTLTEVREWIKKNKDTFVINTAVY